MSQRTGLRAAPYDPASATDRLPDSSARGGLRQDHGERRARLPPSIAEHAEQAYHAPRRWTDEEWAAWRQTHGEGIRGRPETTPSSAAEQRPQRGKAAGPARVAGTAQSTDEDWEAVRRNWGQQPDAEEDLGQDDRRDSGVRRSGGRDDVRSTQSDNYAHRRGERERGDRRQPASHPGDWRQDAPRDRRRYEGDRRDDGRDRRGDRRDEEHDRDRRGDRRDDRGSASSSTRAPTTRHDEGRSSRWSGYR